jgi:hypothetical protein
MARRITLTIEVGPDDDDLLDALHPILSDAAEQARGATLAFMSPGSTVEVTDSDGEFAAY